MKISYLLQRLALATFLFVTVFSCKKSLSPDLVSDSSTTTPAAGQNDSVTTTATTPAIPFPVATNYNCNGPDYGDSVIYPQPVGLLQSYTVTPINNPGPGKYFSWPDGLSLNAFTGAINVTQSETGQRYVIGFVKNGTTDTCLTTMIIGGAAYSDGIYVLDDHQSTASPYYNANPALPPVCTGSSNGQGCVWDPNGLLKAQNIQIDNHTGIINLQETINKGAFPLLINGASVQTTIYYQLNDASNMATQHTPVKLIYYLNKSDIPQSLLDQIANRQNNILQDILILLGGNPRPPLIVITRHN